MNFNMHLSEFAFKFEETTKNSNSVGMNQFLDDFLCNGDGYAYNLVFNRIFHIFKDISFDLLEESEIVDLLSFIREECL